jgi:hypothetical protein
MMRSLPCPSMNLVMFSSSSLSSCLCDIRFTEKYYTLKNKNVSGFFWRTELK